MKMGKGNEEYIEVTSGLRENDRIAANAYQLFEQFQQKAGKFAQQKGIVPLMPGEGKGMIRQLTPSKKQLTPSKKR